MQPDHSYNDLSQLSSTENMSQSSLNDDSPAPRSPRPEWVDEQSISQFLRCGICRRPLHHPVQTTCGCKACNSCLSAYLASGPRDCPGNNSDCDTLSLDGQSFFPDKGAIRELRQLLVYCANRNSGCRYQLKQRTLNKHLSTECEYRSVTCPDCRITIIAKYLTSHSLECPKRQVACDRCNKVLHHDELVTQHSNLMNNDACCKLEGPCPLCGAGNFTKFSIQSHLPTCPAAPVNCDFKVIGCSKTASRLDIGTHLETDIHIHMKLLLDENQKLKEENVQLSNAISRMKYNTENSNDCAQGKTDLEFSQVLERLNFLELSMKNNLDMYLPAVCQEGVYIWRIDNYGRHFERAKESRVSQSLSSPDFIITETGYRMRLRLYPNGDGNGRGSHLSLFYILVPGKNDPLLSWPFTRPVTLEVLDQSGRLNHKTRDMKWSHSYDRRCFKRPEQNPKPGSSNLAVGFPQFMSHSEMKKTSVQDFIKDDILFIKITVATRD